ncbi:nitroreductase family protein, partial [Actinokineospora sp. PR83]|uniref:Acg family FMN-binding oxidoreductase n=1 Tax=Actinokineospora sp. PR83 TaxID=2884908 RepID=UPI001F2C7D88
NTQPWSFVAAADHIDTRLDRARVLPVADPGGHEARLSCGAALANLRLALRAAGSAEVTTVLPDRADPDLLARTLLGGPHRPSGEETDLARAIPRRHTNRSPFLDREVPRRVRAALVRTAFAEGARLLVPDHPGELVALVNRADHVQGQDEDYRRELRAWVRREPDRTDGVPAWVALRAPSHEGVLVPRDFTDGRDDAAVDRFEQDPLLAVLTTPGDTPRDHVLAGQAMQRVLLRADHEGLASSFLSQPIEVPAVRSALRVLVGGVPHAVLRLGYGYGRPPTPRRPVAEVVTVETGGGDR